MNNQSTTHTIIIKGYSDDLVHIDGAWSEELFSPEIEEGFRVALSDGTLLKIVNEGFVRITPVVIGDGSTYSHRQGLDIENDYSDVVTLTSVRPWTWVAVVAPERVVQAPTASRTSMGRAPRSTRASWR